jgi:hypothetical protein
VALLSADEGLARALELNGCALLVDPGSAGELAAFAPQVVVALDGFASQGAEGFRLLASAAPAAELVFSFANAGASSALLPALLGAPTAAGLSEREVRGWLTAAGWAVASREVVLTPHAPSGLAPDTEASLRALFEQLNPDAAADRLLLVARRGAAAPAVERVPGLVSVVVSGGPEALLAGTLGSLGAQRLRPLELVVSQPPGAETEADAAIGLRRLAGLTVTRVTGGAGAAAGANAGLAAARGRYVAFAEAGDRFDPGHLQGLFDALASGTGAWALAAPRRQPFRLARSLEAGAVGRAGWLVDRARLGAFALTFPEHTPWFEHVLFTRLALLFGPALVEGNPTTGPRRAPRGALVALLRGRPLRTLASLESLLEPPDLAALAEARLEALRPGAGRALAGLLALLKARGRP